MEKIVKRMQYKGRTYIAREFDDRDTSHGTNLQCESAVFMVDV